MASLSLHCGACEFTSDCANEREEHRRKEHPTRFNVHGRCGICNEIYSDLFSYLDHFEEAHADQFEILVNKGIEMMRYRTPCPLLFVFRTYIKNDGDAKMDFTDKETLHRLVRSVVYELGISGSDCESSEEDLEDGDDPPSSPSPQPPDRPSSPIEEITVIQVKLKEPLVKTEETQQLESKENIMRNNFSQSESSNSYPKGETIRADSDGRRIEETAKPIHGTTIINQLDSSRDPISELQRLLDSSPVPIDEYHQREAAHQEKLRQEKEEKEKNERMQLIVGQNKRGKANEHQQMKRNVEKKQLLETEKNNLRQSMQMLPPVPPQLQQQMIQRPQTLPHSSFTTSNQIPLPNHHLVSPNVSSTITPSYGTPINQFGFTPNGLPGLPIQNHLSMMAPTGSTPVNDGLVQSPGVYPFIGQEGMPLLMNMNAAAASTMQQYQMQQFLQQQTMMNQNNQQRIFMQHQMNLQLQLLQQTAMASSAMGNISTAAPPVPPQFFAPSYKAKRRASDELPQKRTHASQFTPKNDKKRRVDDFVDRKETKIQPRSQPLVIVKESNENVVRPTVLPTDTNTLLVKTDHVQESMVSSPKSGISNSSLPSIHSPMKLEEKINPKCEQKCEKLEDMPIISPVKTLQPHEKTSTKIDEKKDGKIEELPVLLSPTDPPGKTDQDFWSGKSSSRYCPRGCGFVGETKAEKQNHYKKCHYTIFYVVEKGVKAKQENWFEQNLGCSSQGDRICNHCPSSLNLFKNRFLLLLHIREMHPQTFVDMSREYLAIPMKRGETPLYRQLDELLRAPLPSLIFVQSSVDKNTHL